MEVTTSTRYSSRHPIAAYYSLIDPEGMKGWVGLVGWPVADGLPTLVVIHRLLVECRTGKVRRLETDVLTTAPRHQPYRLNHITQRCETVHKSDQCVEHGYVETWTLLEHCSLDHWRPVVWLTVGTAQRSMWLTSIQYHQTHLEVTAWCLAAAEQVE